jgi:uncharacterized protein YdhG (YjbR/CyaY superfamily)
VKKKPSRSAAKKRPAARKSPSSKVETVEQYVARVPKAARGTFNKLRQAVRASVPAGASEIISYRIPAFKDERVLVWFAAFAKHCSLFPTNAIIEQFREELKQYSISKGTIQFPLHSSLPTALIKRIVKARVAQSKR